MRILITILLLAVFSSMPGASSFADSVTRTAVLSRPVIGTGMGSPTRTGQTISYQPGDDGDLEKGSPVYPAVQYANTPGTSNSVTDNGTGLIWIKNESIVSGTGYDFSLPMNYPAALSAITALNASNGGAGYDGSNQWRLPKVKELLYILDFSRHSPSINPIFTCRSSDYWSGTIWYPTVAARPMTVNFNHVEPRGATPGAVLNTYTHYVRPVRDGS